MSKMNHYGQDINYADSSDIFEKTANFIRSKMSRFDHIIKIDAVKDKQLQFSGVDKIVVTQSGKVLRLEEKVRRKDWGDLLVEVIADNRFAKYDPVNNSFEYEKKRGVGWGMKEYSTDLLLYYFEESDTGYILSWKKFKAMFDAMLPTWYIYAQQKQFGFDLKVAKNKGYQSINIAIPKDIFIEAYKKTGGAII
jgi:hypothetical protein